MFGVRFFKSSINPTKKNSVLRMIIAFKKLSLKIELSISSNIKKKLLNKD